MDADKLKGMAIVSIAEGATLGHVEDVLIDTAALRIDAFQVKGDRQRFIVPFDQVRNIGADAVTVESRQAARVLEDEAAIGGLAGLERFKRLKVVDDAGTFLGTVNNIEIDQAGGRVVGITVHKGGAFGFGGETTTIEAGNVRGVGAEVMTVGAAQATTPTADQ